MYLKASYPLSDCFDNASTFSVTALDAENSGEIDLMTQCFIKQLQVLKSGIDSRDFDFIGAGVEIDR